MSLSKELRLQCPDAVHSVLVAYAKATGKDVGELVREILRAWTEERLREYEIIHRMLGKQS